MFQSLLGFQVKSEQLPAQLVYHPLGFISLFLSYLDSVTKFCSLYKRILGLCFEHEGKPGSLTIYLSDRYVELKPEVVEFRTLHKREEELYFYDTFAYPWEKEKHYKMVYQLEKKYFPDQGFDKAFLDPSQMNVKAKAERDKKGRGSKSGERREKGGDGRDEKGLVFFEEGEEGKEEREKGLVKDVKIDISEKKVEEFFKCLKKVPTKDGEVANAEPFVSSRSTGLPTKWDSPTGNVVLVNKPKGE